MKQRHIRLPYRHEALCMMIWESILPQTFRGASYLTGRDYAIGKDHRFVTLGVAAL